MLVECGERKTKGELAMRDAVDGSDGAKSKRRAAAALVLAHELYCACHRGTCVKKPSCTGTHDAACEVDEQCALDLANSNLALTTEFSACKATCNSVKIDFANGCGHVPARPALNNGGAHDGIALAGNGRAGGCGIPWQPAHSRPLTSRALADGRHG